MATMTLDELVAQLRAAFGADLRAVVLFGSAAVGEHIPKRSDYNVLVIAESLGLERLHALSPTARAWAEAGNHPPLTFTTSEWRSSADIFPMEYADILERHRVLYGTPPFEGIHVDPVILRRQLEHEAMGKLLKLRRGILATGGDVKRQTALLADSASTIMVIFRALVRLHGETPSTDNVALASTVGRYAGFDPAPFARVVQHVRGERTLTSGEAPGVLTGYLAGMQQLVDFLDRYVP
jgi:hypothetical protein